MSKDLRMPIKKIKAWFINMRRKAKRHSLKDSSSDALDVTLQEQYPNIKLPSVCVLMDMKSINAMKNSLESPEIVIDDEDEIPEKSGASFDEKDISKLDTSALLGINLTLKDVMQNNQDLFVDDGTPLIKECTTTNQYIETLLQKIECLEDTIKEKEGKVYFAEKELKENQAKLKSTEIVLNTVQESIPKVVRDHRKALLEKDAEILRWKSHAENESKASMVTGENEKDFHEEAEKKFKVHISQLENELKQKDHDLNIMRSKVESDHEKTLLEKDAEILRWKSHAENDMKALKVKDENNKQMEQEILDLKSKLEMVNHGPKKDPNEEAEKKFKVHITQLQNELKNKEDDYKIMRFKVKQAEQNEKMRLESEGTSNKLSLEVAKLRQTVEAESQKRADLELDVFSKSVEIKSMAQTISTLNEKLQQLKKGKCENPSTSKEISNLSSSVPSVRDEISFNQSVVQELFTDIMREI